AAMLLALPDNHALDHSALLRGPVRRGFFHGGRDHIAQAGAQAGVPAQRQNHLQPARAAVVGHVEDGSHHHCHVLVSTWTASRPPLGSQSFSFQFLPLTLYLLPNLASREKAEANSNFLIPICLPPPPPHFRLL